MIKGMKELEEAMGGYCSKCSVADERFRRRASRPAFEERVERRERADGSDTIASIGTASTAPETPHIQNQKVKDRMTSTG